MTHIPEQCRTCESQRVRDGAFHCLAGNEDCGSGYWFCRYFTLDTSKQIVQFVAALSAEDKRELLSEAFLSMPAKDAADAIVNGTCDDARLEVLAQALDGAGHRVEG